MRQAALKFWSTARQQPMQCVPAAGSIAVLSIFAAFLVGTNAIGIELATSRQAKAPHTWLGMLISTALWMVGNLAKGLEKCRTLSIPSETIVLLVILQPLMLCCQPA